ncbi:hypothetical protein, unlikely [Trypanosoma brucei gambiense DAL972]|uniref:Uncharacterized protein n=1 Tax=Trypanosoma brucei gambiense (strain MHOM/CI/86/DAL972) TaxID=679716 RepID=D0A1J6_TRYB9|nr:hypothetical protein, unlikely [Trypanosoma brucei gambiense DAL972]CBH15138.1 hypothetical protein, unlikely [Trypanosoma brucei gambiense DAL972]|eukprot:XP_011777404.1 hypothetical protein, unlikely [Trypanosoma brucei gambiense DAL972]
MTHRRRSFCSGCSYYHLFCEKKVCHMVFRQSVNCKALLPYCHASGEMLTEPAKFLHFLPRGCPRFKNWGEKKMKKLLGGEIGLPYCYAVHPQCLCRHRSQARKVAALNNFTFLVTLGGCKDVFHLFFFFFFGSGK